MAFEALINTITLICLVLFGLWFIAHVVQAIQLLLMRSRYRQHDKHTFTIPFVPLETRLFHELAVPQYLAAEAIQRGDLPPAPRVPRLEAIENVHPSVAPSVAPPKSPNTPSTPTSTSVLPGSPLSTQSNTDDSRLHKPNKKVAVKAAVKSAKSSKERAHTTKGDAAVAVPVPLEPTALQSTEADANTPSWWSPKLEGQNLVLGLHLPLELLPTAEAQTVARQAEKNASAANTSAARPHHAGRPSSSSPSKQASNAKSGTSSTTASGSASALQRRQPTVNLQLRQYRLTSSSLMSLTAPFAEKAHAHMSNVRSARRVQHASHHRNDGGADASQQQLHAAIAAQLAHLPMFVSSSLNPGDVVPRLAPGTSLPLDIAASSPARTAAPPVTRMVDFDSVKYAYIRYYQRLLEVAVAEQTAMAHRGKQDRKSAKRAQRIAAVLMQYLQYTHEDDDEETVLDDSIDDGIGSSADNTALHNSGLETGGSSSLLETSQDASGAGTPVRRRGTRAPWVPLLSDARDDQGGLRRFDSFIVSGATAAGQRKLSQSFSQRSPAATQPSSTVKAKKGGAPAVITVPAASPSPAVVAPLPPVHESRRSTRKRREAAADIADSAVVELEMLVERVRQAQALRPRYQSLLCTLNFRAERFIVRHGASGPPTWMAVFSASSSPGFGSQVRASSHAHQSRSGNGRSQDVYSPNGNGPRSTGSQPRQLSAYTRNTSSGVYDFTHSDTVTAVSQSGEFAPDSSSNSVHDTKTEKEGGASGGGNGRHRRTSTTAPPSPEESTAIPLRRNLNTDFTELTSFPEEDFRSPLGTPEVSQQDSSELPSVLVLPAGPQTLPRPALTLSPDHLRVSDRSDSSVATTAAAAAAAVAGSGAASVTPMGSTSANNAAMEFLRASRQAQNKNNNTSTSQFSFDASATPSTNASRQHSSGGRGSDGGSWNSPLDHRRRRGSADPSTLVSTDVASNTASAAVLQRDTSSLLSEADPLRVLSPDSVKGSTAPHRQQQAHGRAAKARAAAADTAVTPLSVSVAETPPPPPLLPPEPRETDLRVVYIIGADRATLLRSLTLHATKTFSAGAQNFICFFTHKDEQRARRRYLEEADRQYRRDLQKRLMERVHGVSRASAGRATVEAQPSDSDSNDEFSGKRQKNLSQYRMSSATEVSQQAVAGASAGAGAASTGKGSTVPILPFRHTRTTSWHSVGVSGSGVFTADSADFDGDGAGPSDQQRGRHTPSQSFHSLHSFPADSTYANAADENGSTIVVSAHAKDAHRDPGPSPFGASSTLGPHSLEASLCSRGDEQGLLSQPRTSLYGPSGELIGTQGFETVPSLPSTLSSSSSANSSLTSLPSKKERTIIGPARDAGGKDTTTTGPPEEEDGAETRKASFVSDGCQLQSLPSSDSAFAHSLHSVNSAPESNLVDPAVDTGKEASGARSGTGEASVAPVIVQAAKPLSVVSTKLFEHLESREAEEASKPAATPAAAAATPFVPPASKEDAGNVLEKDAADAKGKKSGKKVSSPLTDTLSGKQKGKKGQKTATAETSTPEMKKEPATATPTVNVSASLLPAPLSVPKLSLELPDTIGDHDVRRYHAAIGITLPEQVFLLRDFHDDMDASLTAAASAGGHSGTYYYSNNGSASPGNGVGKEGGGGKQRRRSASPSRRSGSAAAHGRAMSSSFASQIPAAASAMAHGASSGKNAVPPYGVARVLEGQVEVAELSVDVLARQLSPFVPQQEPTPGTPSSDSSSSGGGADDDEDNDATTKNNNKSKNKSNAIVSSSSDVDENGAGSSSSSDIRHRHSSSSSHTDSASSGGDDDDSDDGDDYSSRGKNGKRDRRARPQKGSGARVRSATTREEREARANNRPHSRSSSRKTAAPAAPSQRHRETKKARRAAAAARRAKRQRRRQRERQRAAWRRRLRRKQAAVTKAGVSPISVAMLFFTGPPVLPPALLQQLQAQRATYELAPLPLPSWALADVPSTTPLEVGVRRVTEDSFTVAPATTTIATDHPCQLSVLQRPPQRLPSICVTLIYTSTAEQVTQALLVAGEVASSARAARRSMLDYATSDSLTADPTTSRRRGSWVDEMRDGQLGERQVSSTTSRYHSGPDDDSFPRNASTLHTSPPTPDGSFLSRSRVMGTTANRNEIRDSFYNSLNISPPPHVGSGTATFAGDADSLLSSDKETPLPRSQLSTLPKKSDADGASSKSDVAERTTDGEAGGKMKSPPLPPLLLLTESANSFRDDTDHFSGSADPSFNNDGSARSATTVFMDNTSSFGSRRLRMQDTMTFNDDGAAAAAASSVGGDSVDGNNGWQPCGELRFLEDDATTLGNTLTTAANHVVDVLRDSASFPAGVPVGVSLTYVRIGNDLYAVTEVVDRTFLQYREERVIQPNARHNESSGGKANANGDGVDDAASVSSNASSTFSDNGDDAESKNGMSSLSNNSSFSSDTPFSTLDAALEAIQNQHEATARQQRRRMHHRRRAVSTMNFGNLSYSISGSAPLRPGTRRQEVHMCWRCLSAEAAVIFLPCGHYAVCEECAETLADCCVCKTPIQSSVVLLERKKAAPTRPSSTSPKQQQQQRSSSKRHHSPRDQHRGEQ